MRSFERTAIRVPGAPNVSAYQIRCSKCGAIEKVSSNTSSGTVAPELLASKFRNAGWIVGSKEYKDICPKCQEEMRKKGKQKPMASIAATAPVVVADPPREMSRQDKLIIIAKIMEVYLDENTGYASGWSDKAVASFLGVPLAWARDVRSELFGDEGINEDARPLLEEAKKLLEAIQAEAQILTERLEQGAQARAEMVKRADHLAGRITAMEKIFK